MVASPASDKVFAGSIPRIYETYLVPLIFEPYAVDLAERLPARSLARVLEVAAGTGVVTRRLAAVLPSSVEIVATDLNQAMLDMAASTLDSNRVAWRQADAMQLPFGDASFDAVVCQFGAMFFPDRPHAFAEAHRVLKPGGTFLFSVWDRIEENEFADAITSAVALLFPDDPPRFLARTPHGYHDRDAIARDVAAGGFTQRTRVDTIAARSRAASADEPAFAYCKGTPLRNEIEARDPARLDEATAAGAAAIRARFGNGRVDGKIQAHVVSAERLA
jgi:SAM-dependent methyltransferase